MSDDIKKKLGVDETHQKMYDELFADMVNHTVDQDPQMVASVFVALGLRLYRSCLPQEDFEKLLNVFAESSRDIRPFQDELKKKILPVSYTHLTLPTILRV